MKTQRSQTHLLSDLGQRYQHFRGILPPPKVNCNSQVVKNCPPVVFFVAVVSLTGTMGQRFYNVPELYVGTKSPETIIAPQNASVEDQRTTKEQREAARKGAVPVLMINEIVTQQIYADIERSLRTADQLRVTAGAFPFVPTTVLSISSQVALRKFSQSKWETLLTILNSNNQKDFPDKFNATVKELQTTRQKISVQKFTDLIQTIAEARQRYSQALALLSTDLKLSFRDDNPVEIPKPLLTPTNNRKSNLVNHQLNIGLLDLPDNIWEQTQTSINQAATNILTQGIPPGLPPNILQAAIKMQVSSLVPTDAQPIAIQLLLNFLRDKSNLTKDKEQTQLQAEQAAQAVQPVILSVRTGEVIVYKDGVINQTSFVLLDKFGLSRRGISWQGLIGFGGLVSVTIFGFWLVQRHFYPQMRRRDYLVILLLTLSTPILINCGLNYTNLPLVGLLIGSFYSSALGVTVVALLSGVLSISLETGKDYLIASAIGSLVGSLLAGRMRSREELAFLGGTIALIQGFVYLIISLILSGAAGAVWYILLQEAALFSVSGLVWSIVALGVSPYLEHLFDLITPIRLAELSNPNRPLLKRLAAETPGTFQHTLFVATLAEAAARVVSCNVELVRAGTLYHDIGKMHDPLGFIENQMGGPNKHDEINDPWESVEIIKKHVTQGLVMARKYRLPKAVQAFIPEHQGKILIAYFYHQAQQIVDKQMENDRPITCVLKEEDFRYEGPIPQSRETGIVMLADACEAALRSLKEATPEQALSTINKILRARWQDNQLVDSGLKKEELAIIAEVFVQVWQQYNHQRIAYPKKL